MCWRGMMSTIRTHTKVLSCAISVCSGEGKTSSLDHTSLIFLSIHTCSFTHLPQHVYRPEKTNMCENLNFVHQELSNEKAACLLLMQELKMTYEKLNFVQKELLKEKVAKLAACVQLVLAQKDFLKRGKEIIANQATCSKTQLDRVHKELNLEKVARVLLVQEWKMTCEKLESLHQELSKEKTAKQAACKLLDLVQKESSKEKAACALLAQERKAQILCMREGLQKIQTDFNTNKYQQECDILQFELTQERTTAASLQKARERARDRERAREREQARAKEKERLNKGTRDCI